MPDAETVKRATTAYLNRGWKIFPVHSIRNGSALCTCGDDSCPNPGKHPVARLAPQGLLNATESPEIFTDWLTGNPWINVGIRTGAESGIVVLDIDPGHGGNETLATFVCDYGPLPPTPMVITGSGGTHYYFKHPGFPIRTRTNVIGIGVDVRADGGYVVAPPSAHVSGGGYYWDKDALPGVIPFADIPIDLLSALLKETRSPFVEAPVESEVISEPGRNVALARIAGAMRRQGMAEEEIFNALMDINSRRVQPPLQEREIHQIAFGMKRYHPVKEPIPFTTAEPEDLGLTSLSDLLEEPEEKLNWLVDGLLLRGGMSILVSKPKVGKAQGVNDLVLTPAGFVRMGDIKVGDHVVGRNGKPTRVLEVHPQGVRQLYRVTMTDGTSTRCVEDHLWLTETHNDRTYHPGGQVRTLAEIKSRLRREAPSCSPDHALPMYQPVEWSASPLLPLDPYLLGLLIGDGSFTNNGITFCKPEQDVVDRLGQCLPTEDMLTPRSDLMTWGIAKRDQATPGPTKTKTALVELGLMGKHSWNKFIPERYQIASIEQRTQLLRGLVDTDGYVIHHGQSIEYSTSSAQLALDVLNLVRSLGGVAKMRRKMCHYTKDGERHDARDAYQILMSFENGVCPVSSEKHLAKWGSTGSRPHHRSIDKIELDVMEECQCITVEAKDGIYLTNDFIPTHNSLTLRNLVYAMASGAEEFLGRKCQQGRVVYLALEEHRIAVKDHFTQMGATREVVGDRAHVWVGLGPSNGLEWLAWMIEEYEPDLLIFDPAQSLLRLSNLNDYAEVKKVLDNVMSIARAANVHVMIAHHSNKMTLDSLGDSVLGSTAFFAAPDVLIGLESREGIRLIKSINRYGEPFEEQVVVLDRTSGLVSLGNSLLERKLELLILEVESHLSYDEDTLGSTIQAKTGIDPKNIGIALRSLVDSGRVERFGTEAPFKYRRKTIEPTQDGFDFVDLMMRNGVLDSDEESQEI